MLTKKIILTGLFVIGCLCMTGYPGGVMAGDKVAGTEVKNTVISKDKIGYPVIGHLKKRGMIITIRTGPDGPLYTVKTKDGETLAVNLPAEILYAEFPDLKNVIDGGMAVEDAAYREYKR